MSSNKKLETLQLLFDSGIDKNIKFENGKSLLMISIVKGDDDVVKFLLDSDDIDLNMQDDAGKTALFYACTVGDDIYIKLLFRYLIDPFIKLPNNDTIVDYLRKRKSDFFDMVNNYQKKYKEMCFAAKNNMRKNCDITYSPLMKKIIDYGNLDDLNDRMSLYNNIKLLLETGMNPNYQNNMGKTALMIACSIGSAKLVELLMNYGTNPHLQDKFGLTADDYIKTNFEQIVPLLTRNFGIKEYENKKVIQ